MSYTGADRAVDGHKTHLGQYGGECAASLGSNTAEWRVDLGVARKIRHILIQFMTANWVWGNVSFIIIYSSFNFNIHDCLTDYLLLILIDYLYTVQMKYTSYIRCVNRK